MLTNSTTKFTIKQFHEKYPNNEACLQQVFENRYGYLESCPECEGKFSFYKVAGRKCYACAHCGYQLHPLANTIFHKSSTELKNWFFAIFLFSASKNGVAAKELQRQLGVTYKCAHRMGRQIRKLFDATLADLYDPDVMPPNLRKALHALDAAVDKLYRKTPFTSDRERVEHLFGLYEKLVAPSDANSLT